MGKQTNFSFSLLPSTFSYKNFEGLSRLLTDINFHVCIERKQ